MAELLQLHVTIPEEQEDGNRGVYNSRFDRDRGEDVSEDDRFDDLMDTLSSKFAVPSDVEQPDGSMGIWCSTKLFERRQDNMDRVDEIQSDIEEQYPDATVLRSNVEHFFGEFRSVSNPDTHVVISVTNWGIQRPSVSWRRDRDTLATSPLVRENKVYHADNSGVFSLDGATGKLLWETQLDDVVRVPVGGDGLLVASGNWSVTALDAGTGDVRWRTEFDRTEENILDSRVRVGVENAYVGTRSGDVRAFSLDDGSWSTLSEFDRGVVTLMVNDDGILVGTSDGVLTFLGEDGSERWTREFEKLDSVLGMEDETVFAIETQELHAVSTDGGTTTWTAEIQGCRSVAVTGDTLVAYSTFSVCGIDVETGEKQWDRERDIMTTLALGDPTDDGVAAIRERNEPTRGPISGYRESSLLQIDPRDGDESFVYQLGVDSYHAPVGTNEGLICSNGSKMICLENLPAISEIAD